MDPRAFALLYVNVNSLLELGLQRAAQRMAAECGPATPRREPGEVDMMAAFANLDLSALDLIEIGPASIPDAPPPRRPESLPPSVGEPLDIARYLTRAYEAERGDHDLRERISAHFTRADVASLDLMLSQLPAALAPLTGPLTADDMSRWVDLYDSRDAVLSTLVSSIRALDV